MSINSRNHNQNKKVIGSIVAILIGGSAIIFTTITFAQQSPVTQEQRGYGNIQAGGDITAPPKVDIKKDTTNVDSNRGTVIKRLDGDNTQNKVKKQENTECTNIDRGSICSNNGKVENHF